MENVRFQGPPVKLNDNRQTYNKTHTEESSGSATATQTLAALYTLRV